jgi:hypothetical protein
VDARGPDRGLEGMASIERTAYPRLKRQVSARELRDAYALSSHEADWVREATRSDEHRCGRRWARSRRRDAGWRC